MEPPRPDGNYYPVSSSSYYKRRRYRGFINVIIVLLFVTAAGLGVYYFQSQPVVPRYSPIGHTGDTLTLDRYTLTLNGVETMPPGLTMPAKPGYHFLAVYLTVKVSDERLNRRENLIQPAIRRVRDTEGYTYDLTVFNREPSLNYTFFHVGDKVQGWLTFQVPEKAQGLVMEYILGNNEFIFRYQVDPAGTGN